MLRVCQEDACSCMRKLAENHHSFVFCQNPFSVLANCLLVIADIIVYFMSKPVQCQYKLNNSEQENNRQALPQSNMSKSQNFGPLKKMMRQMNHEGVPHGQLTNFLF